MPTIHELKKYGRYWLFLFSLVSCQKQESSKIEEQKRVYASSPKTEVSKDEKVRVNPTLVFYPLMKNVPCSFALKPEQLHDFIDFFYSGSFTIWFNYNIAGTDSLVHINISIKPTFGFIKNFLNNSYYRFRNNIDYSPPCITAITNPDSLSEMNIPMLTQESCKSLFNESDSVYLFYSLEHYSKPSVYFPRLMLQHLFYNHHQKSFVLMSLDTLGQLIDSMTLFNLTDSTSKFVLRFPIPSAIQVIKHTTQRKQDYYFTEDSFEIKRIYTSISGKIYNWTDTMISLDKYSYKIPFDSTFDKQLHWDTLMAAVPLPLNSELIIKKYQLDTYNTHSKNLYFGNRPSLDLYSIDYSIQFDNKIHGIVFDVKDESFLALFNEDGVIQDTRNMSQNEVFLPEHTWTNSHGKLSSNHRIYLIDIHNQTDTMDGWEIKENKIVSLFQKTRILTFPYGYLDDYFPAVNEKIFDFENLNTAFSFEENGKSFPDSILTCIQEVAKMNGTNFYGKNYSIHHTSNGLTYLVLYHEGEVESRLDLMVIDQDNILLNGSYPLAGGGGDEGDYSISKGYFINDSTYFQIGKSCYYETKCDSFVNIVRISNKGKIISDDQSKYYELPYR